MKNFYLLFLFFISHHFIFAQPAQAEISIDRNIRSAISVGNLHEREQLLLILKAESEKLSYITGILKTGGLLMTIYGGQSRYEEEITLGRQLIEIGKNRIDIDGLTSSIYRKMGFALGHIGLNSESIQHYEIAINYAKEITNSDRRNYILALCYANKINYFNNKRYENKKFRDSVVINLNKSNKVLLKINDKNNTISANLKYDSFIANYIKLGIFYLEQPRVKGSLKKAEKYLMEALHKSNRYKTKEFSNVMLLNQISWLYMEKKEIQKSIDYATKALEFEKKHPDPYHRVESYEFLAKGYMEQGEKLKSKFFMGRYTFLKDSLAVADKNKADSTIKKIVTEVNAEHQESSRIQFIVTCIIITIASIIIAILWKLKSKTYYKTLKEKEEKKEVILPLIEIKSDKNNISNNEINLNNKSLTIKNKINAETEARILNDLKIFEESEYFLEKDFTSTVLANQLNTNPRYLSEIIKEKRGQNFSDYINSLKINYIVTKLYEEPKFRDYKISYLAEISGYASPQVFAIAFKKIHGVTPSNFLQNLRQEKP